MTKVHLFDTPQYEGFVRTVEILSYNVQLRLLKAEAQYPLLIGDLKTSQIQGLKVYQYKGLKAYHI
jgi:hypothetical protein